MLSRKLFENVNSLFANESDGYKTTSAPSAFLAKAPRHFLFGTSVVHHVSDSHVDRVWIPSQATQAGSGANLLSVCICLARGFVDFKRPGARSKFPERWLHVQLVV